MIDVSLVLPYIIILTALTLTLFDTGRGQSSVTYDSLLNLPVNYSVFGPVTYHAEMRWFPNGTLLYQHQRLETIRDTLIATITAFEKAKLHVYLEAGTLLGYLRHEGDLIPWDSDADVNFYSPDCYKLFKTSAEMRASVVKHIDLERYHVPYITCGRNRTDGSAAIPARVIDKSTGFYVDIFGIGPVPAKNRVPYKAAPGEEWLRLEYDWRDIFFKNTSIFPLQQVKFRGVNAWIPAKPYDILHAEYGQDLGVPLQYRLYEEYTLSTASQKFNKISLFLQACGTGLLIMSIPRCSIRVAVIFLLILPLYRLRRVLLLVLALVSLHAFKYSGRIFVLLASVSLAIDSFLSVFQ